MVELRLEPEDEFMHALEDDASFNESMYFNAFDHGGGFGGFFRIGNRANEGYAEVTVCVYLADGRVAFTYARPEIAGNGAFDAGGLGFEIVTPFKEQRIEYSGRLVILDDPLQMADPRRAFKANPWVAASASVVWKGLSPMFGGELVGDDGEPLARSSHEQAFARGHYEQHGVATGTIRIGDNSLALDGLGLRDHSWGPRSWQAPWWYRWLTMNFPAGSEVEGAMLSVVAQRDGSRRIGGMVLSGGEYRLVEDAKLETDCDPSASPGPYPQQIRATLRTFDDEYEVAGQVQNLIPLRNRKPSGDGDELVTRIAEGYTRWHCRGADGYGIAEYLDQVVDGTPVGVAEE